MTALVLVTIVALAAVAALVFITLRSQLGPGPSLLTKTMVVHTRDGQDLRGVLVAQHADRISLKDVVVLHGSGDQAVGGLVHVPHANVSSLQEIAST